jgi:hypothetical protein
MKTTLLTLLALFAAITANAIEFPFTADPSITFLQVGDNQYPEAGAYLTLNKEGDHWVIAAKDLKANQETRREELTEEKATEILSAFSALYAHWHHAPKTDTMKKKYSIVVHLNSYQWTTQLSVKDSGSEQLTHLLNLLEYTD